MFWDRPARQVLEEPRAAKDGDSCSTPETTDSASAPPHFEMNETVRFVARGDKLREIEALVAGRGFVLVGSNSR